RRRDGGAGYRLSVVRHERWLIGRDWAQRTFVKHDASEKRMANVVVESEDAILLAFRTFHARRKPKRERQPECAPVPNHKAHAATLDMQCDSEKQRAEAFRQQVCVATFARAMETLKVPTGERANPDFAVLVRLEAH